MNKLLTIFALCAIPVCLSLPRQANAWTATVDCEGGTVGRIPANTNVAYWGVKTSLVTEQIGTGSQSCKFSIDQGSEGWPSSGGPLEFGGIFAFPAPVPVGREIWTRVSLYVPSGFQIVSNSGMLKFLRIHTRTATANTGCLDFLFGTGLPLWDPVLRRDAYPQHVVNFEGAPGLSLIGTGGVTNVAQGTWETYEIYVKVDTRGRDSGGTGVVKAWKNNTLIADISQTSASDATGILDSLYLFTYWNGNSPQTQSLYVDDIILTTDTPANRDSAGNSFIGASIPRAAPRPVSPAPASIR